VSRMRDYKLLSNHVSIIIIIIIMMMTSERYADYKTTRSAAQVDAQTLHDIYTTAHKNVAGKLLS